MYNLGCFGLFWVGLFRLFRSCFVDSGCLGCLGCSGLCLAVSVRFTMSKVVSNCFRLVFGGLKKFCCFKMFSV